MSETKQIAAHTPGPWKAMAGPPEYARIDSADERDIARCPRKENTTRAEANAYLVAAAPEMLEALVRVRMVVKAYGLDDKLYDTMGYVEAAIQKARGVK